VWIDHEGRKDTKNFLWQSFVVFVSFVKTIRSLDPLRGDEWVVKTDKTAR